MRALAAGALLLLLGFLDLAVPSAALVAPRRLALGHRLLSLREKLQASGLRTDEALQKVLLTRGGGDDDEEDEENEEDFEEDGEEAGAGSRLSEEEEEEDELADDGAVNEGDFNDGSLWSTVKKEYLRTPPITKGYLWGSVGLTLACYLLNGNKWPQWLLLEWKPVLTRLQVWRPLTSFLFLGQLGLNYVLSAHFMWTYMAHLEKLKCKDPADFLIMLLFGAASLLVASQVLGFPPVYLGHNLSCYLVYIWSRMFEGQDVDVMGLFHLQAHLLPWFFVAQTLVLEQELPISDLVGIAVGHVYTFLHSRKLLRPPQALRDVFARKEVRRLYRKFEDELQ